MFDVFISHSSADANIAFALCEFLEKNDLKCWIAPRNVNGGKRYSEEIIEGINDSQVFLLLYSSSSNTSEHVINELDIAFNSKKVIIPFCLDNGAISKAFLYYLSATQRIIGYPSPSEKYEEIMNNIISNIPSLAMEKEHEMVWNNIANEVGMTVEKLKECVKKIAEAETSSKNKYEFFQNDKGEIMLIISPLDSLTENPLFFLDRITKYALLYRNQDSTVFFDDIHRDINEVLRQIGEILIVEADEKKVICEYKAPVHVVEDVRELMDDDPVHDDEHDLLDNIGPSEEDNFAEVVFSDSDDVMILYDGDQIDESMSFLYQDSGDNILFPTESSFIVPSRITDSSVTHLSLGGKVYVHCLKRTMEKGQKERDRIFDAIDKWIEDGNTLPPNTIEAKCIHVISILIFLSRMWQSGGGEE